MSVDPRLIHLYSYYRDAELRGATLILMLTMRVEDAESQVKLSRHLADETRHVWLWTKRITDLGHEPVRIDGLGGVLCHAPEELEQALAGRPGFLADTLDVHEQLLHRPVRDLSQQVELRREVVEEGLVGDVCALADLRDLGCPEAVLGEEIGGRFEVEF